jgi:hypothetical protein
MRKLIKTSGVLVVAGLFSTAHAVDALPSADIRCLIVGSLLSNSTDATQRSAGNLLTMYWIGRLDSFPAQDIEDAMISESIGLTPTQIKAEVVRCGNLLQDKGRMIEQIGNNIVRRSKEMNKQNPTPAGAPNDSKPTTQF